MSLQAQAPIPPHIPVLLQEMLGLMAPAAGEVHVDATFGAGGYSRALLEAAPCQVIALDRDPGVEEEALVLQQEYGARFSFVSGSFGSMGTLLPEAGYAKVDGIVMDIGVSSMQIDQPERGFSFQKDGPLDMRMSQAGLSAQEVVNTAEEAALADIIYYYGEEKAARKVARAIVAARQEKPIERTLELAEIVRVAAKRYYSHKGYGKGKSAVDPATRTFQALRIHVNDELGELERALEAAVELLAPGGRLVVVTFHSLEDRIVKRFFAQLTGHTPSASRHVPDMMPRERPQFTLLNKKPVVATEWEAAKNTRARSAKLRALCRLEGA